MPRFSPRWYRTSGIQTKSARLKSRPNHRIRHPIGFTPDDHFIEWFTSLHDKNVTHISSTGGLFWNAFNLLNMSRHGMQGDGLDITGAVAEMTENGQYIGLRVLGLEKRSGWKLRRRRRRTKKGSGKLCRSQ